MKALVATSSDPGIQEFIHQWLVKQQLYGEHVRLANIGSVKDRETLMKNIRFARKHFDISVVYLINCQKDVAYVDRNFASVEVEKEAHRNDLRNTKAAIKAEFPQLDVHTFYLNRQHVISEVD